MIAIINTGCANINSVRFAFERLGVTPTVITAPEQLADFERAILPGVGHAKVAMDRLENGGWREAIETYQKPLLGICLGMQMLCESSSEGDVRCLGVIPGSVTTLDTGTLTTPHMGWNNLSTIKAHPLTRGINETDQVYFVHGFAHTPNQNTLARCEYGNAFSAIVANNNFAGMQFHPERSGPVGARLLQNFIDWKL